MRLVPVEAQAPDQSCQRILVPLDGSRWAESVLPLAARIARAANAEILLAHVVPTPAMIEARPPEMEDEELRQSLLERNEQDASRSEERRSGNTLVSSGKSRWSPVSSNKTQNSILLHPLQS